MADVDIDPFGEHESRPEEPTDENIPLDRVNPGRSTWEPTHEQETSFEGRESQRTKLMKDYVKDLHKKLSENIGEIPELFHYDYFKLEDGELYYRGKRKPLTTKGVLKSVGILADMIVTPALVIFERVVSGALKNGIIDEEEFNMLQTLHLETLNELMGVDCRMEAENRSLVEKSLMEEINEIKKIKEQEFNCLLSVLFRGLL